MAFGGAFYACLEERVAPGELPRLIELGREIKWALEQAHEIVHPLEPELRGVYGVIFTQTWLASRGGVNNDVVGHPAGTRGSYQVRAKATGNN